MYSIAAYYAALRLQSELLFLLKQVSTLSHISLKITHQLDIIVAWLVSVWLVILGLQPLLLLEGGKLKLLLALLRLF